MAIPPDPMTSSPRPATGRGRQRKAAIIVLGLLAVVIAVLAALAVF